jgi:hypothetical protein
MDAVAIGFPEAPRAWHVCEFKTHSEKSFLALKREGVAKSKPLHWAQMQTYMHLAGLERAFYLAVNKNTDELYQERLHYDAEAALRIMAKAERVIAANRPPARISDDPAWWQCRFCEHHATCHEGAMPERHCRSCLHASPIADGSWHCARHNHQLGRREQEAGCVAHLFIPDFIAGEQEDAGEDWVSYRLRDGTEWRDGVADTSTPKLIPHRPCLTCSSTTFRVGPGKGPHIAELICTGCERGGRWLSKADAVTMGVAA